MASSFRALTKARSLSTTPHISPFTAVDAYKSTLGARTSCGPFGCCQTQAKPLGLSSATIPTHVHAPLLSLAPSTSSSTTSQSDSDNLVVPLPSSVFLHSCHPSLFHLLVRQNLASLRAGNASTKSRSEVNYSGRKIRPQKGTGKARLGDRGSPMLRGGGRAFAKKPKDWSFHVNRKMVQKGLKASLSLRWAMGQLDILDAATLPVLSKTKDALSLLGAQKNTNLDWTAERGTLCYLGQETLVSEAGQALTRSTRNIPNIQVADTLSPLSFNVYELLRPSKVVMDLEALNEVVEMLDPVVELSEEEEAMLQQAMSELALQDAAEVQLEEQVVQA